MDKVRRRNCKLLSFSRGNVFWETYFDRVKINFDNERNILLFLISQTQIACIWYAAATRHYCRLNDKKPSLCLLVFCYLYERCVQCSVNDPNRGSWMTSSLKSCIQIRYMHNIPVHYLLFSFLTKCI